MAIEKVPSRRENTRGSEGAKAKGQQAFVLGQCSLLRFVPDRGLVWFTKGKELFAGAGEAGQASVATARAKRRGGYQKLKLPCLGCF
jgi:hypothetical protein